MKLFGVAIAVAALAASSVHAQSVSDKELSDLKDLYRRPAPQAVENRALVELGRELFFEPKLSASGSTACATCHFPQVGYGVNDAKSKNDAGKLT